MAGIHYFASVKTFLETTENEFAEINLRFQKKVF